MENRYIGNIESTYVLYPTLSDYLEKARSDFKGKKYSPNDEYIILKSKKVSLRKRIKNRLKNRAVF